MDSQGYPLAIHISAANVSDSKSAYPLIANILANNSDIRIIKSDKGYRGEIETLLPAYTSARQECVKSNFGTPDFIPTHGRWVVERTFSWLDTFQSWDVPLWHAIIQDHNTFGIEITSYRRLFGKFRQVSSVTMLASLPLQLAKFPRKYAAPALTIFGERSLCRSVFSG